jgi:hypothetical protein
VEALSSRIHNDWGRGVTAAIVSAEFALTADHASVVACRTRRRTRSGVRGPVGNITALAVALHAEVARGASGLAVEIGLLGTGHHSRKREAPRSPAARNLALWPGYRE